MAEVPPITVPVDMVAQAVIVEVHKMSIAPGEWLVVRVPDGYSAPKQCAELQEALYRGMEASGIDVPVAVMPDSFTMTVTTKTKPRTYQYPVGWPTCQ